MNFPALMIFPDGARRLFQYPDAFSCEHRLTVGRPVVKSVTTTEQVEDPETGELTDQEVSTEVVELVDVEETDTITHPAAVWGLWSSADWQAMCPELTVLPVLDPGPPSVDGKRAIRQPVEDWSVGTDAATVTYALTDLSADEIAAELASTRASIKATVTARRFTAETGGITIGGMTIRTDRESQALINGAYNLARDMLAGDVAETPIEFKGASGWTQIAPAEMVAVGRAVAAHVQACFAHERALHDDIDVAATTADVLAVDINTGWPGASE